MSILTAGMGINFTCISYDEGMDFGIVVEPELVPRHEDLAKGLERALGEYHALCKPKARKKPATKARTKPRKKSV
jgi:hypothetical protein